MIKQQVVIPDFFFRHKISGIHFVNDTLRLFRLDHQFRQIIRIDRIFAAHTQIMGASSGLFRHNVRINVDLSMRGSQKYILMCFRRYRMNIISHKGARIQQIIQSEQYKQDRRDPPDQFSAADQAAHSLGALFSQNFFSFHISFHRFPFPVLIVSHRIFDIIFHIVCSSFPRTGRK